MSFDMYSEWRQVKLGDLAQIKHGFAFKGEFFRDNPNGHVLLTPGNFAAGGGFKDEKLKYYAGPVPEEYVLQPEDVVVTMTDLSKISDTLGYPAVVPNNRGLRYLHNQRLGKVILQPEAPVVLEFLYHLLRSKPYRDEVLASATGTTVKHTSPSRICNFRFFLPPLEVQRAVASILGTLDNKIDLSRRMNRTLEAIAQALFKSWFIDFDPVHANRDGRTLAGLGPDVQAQFPSEFVESEIGLHPRGWRVGTIGLIADLVDCLHSKKPVRQPSGLPLLQLDNIRDNGLIDMTDTYFITEDNYRDWSSRMEAVAGDCVITNVGRVGVAAQIPPGLKAALGRNMSGLRAKEEFPYPTFLIQCLTSSAMREEIGRKTDVGTILDALNVKSIPN